jgi:hypothetical protein
MSDQALGQVPARHHWLNYVALLRFHFHTSFVGVLLGILVTTRQGTAPLLWRTLLLYVSLNVLLYGGLYSLNAVTDAEADSRHPFKCWRPVASGTISRTSATTFGAVLIVAGLVTGVAWLGSQVVLAYLLLLVLNASYSLFFRERFVLDLLFNAATHPPRFWLGTWLAGGRPDWDWLALLFVFAVGLSASRRSVELTHSSCASRASLARYSTFNLLAIKGIALGSIVLLWAVRRPDFQIPYIVTVGAYVVFIGGIEFSPTVRTAFEKFWMK